MTTARDDDWGFGTELKPVTDKLGDLVVARAARSVRRRLINPYEVMKGRPSLSESLSRLFPLRLQFVVRRAGRYGTRRKSGQLVGKTVVDVTVVRLVGSDHQNHITQSGIFRQAPVALGDLRRRNVFRPRLSSISAR